MVRCDHPPKPGSILDTDARPRWKTSCVSMRTWASISSAMARAIRMDDGRPKRSARLCTRRCASRRRFWPRTRPAPPKRSAPAARAGASGRRPAGLRQGLHRACFVEKSRKPFLRGAGRGADPGGAMRSRSMSATPGSTSFAAARPCGCPWIIPTTRRCSARCPRGVPSIPLSKNASRGAIGDSASRCLWR